MQSAKLLLTNDDTLDLSTKWNSSEWNRKAYASEITLLSTVPTSESGNELSDRKLIFAEVPQSAVLSPIPYLHYSYTD